MEGLPKSPRKRKAGHVLHAIKAGNGWSEVSWCGRRFPRIEEGTPDIEHWKKVAEEDTNWICERCRAALQKAKKI